MISAGLFWILAGVEQISLSIRNVTRRKAINETKKKSKQKSKQKRNPDQNSKIDFMQ